MGDECSGNREPGFTGMQNSQDMNIKNKMQRKKKQKKKRKKYCRCNFLWKKENSGLCNFYCDLLSPKKIVKRSQFMYHNHIISSSTNICNILWVVLIISAKYKIILKTRLNRNAVAMKKKKKQKSRNKNSILKSTDLLQIQRYRLKDSVKADQSQLAKSVKV